MLRKFQTPIFIITSLIFLISIGCDPGYRLHPVGWKSVSDYEWSKQFDDFEIQTRGIGDLIGESWASPDLQIYNHTKPISVDSAELRTAKETLQARIYNTKPIPPSKSGYHLSVDWEFEHDRAAPEIVGDGCEIILNLKVGSEACQIKIEYEK